MNTKCLILGALAVVVCCCGCDAQRVDDRQIAVTSKALVDGNQRIMLTEVVVTSAEPFRMVVESEDGGDRDAIQVHGASGERACPAEGRMLVVASLSSRREGDHDALSYLTHLSGPGVKLGGPSQIPVPKGMAVGDLVELLLEDGRIPRGQPRDFLRVHDRVFRIRCD